jgi:hypothetical protein
MKVGYLMNGQLMVCVLNPLQVFSPATHRFNWVLVNNKDHQIFVVNGNGCNLRYKKRKCIGFYLIEPLLDGLFAKLDAVNLSGISNTYNDISTLRIGKRGKRFNSGLIEDGLEFNGFRFAFRYEVQDVLFVHFSKREIGGSRLEI